MMNVLSISPAYLSDKDLLSEYNNNDNLKAVQYTSNKVKAIQAEVNLRKRYSQKEVFTAEKLTIPHLTSPYEELIFLQKRYENGNGGRIPIPKNPMLLWQQHKYSVMARSIKWYKEIGRKVSVKRDTPYFKELTTTLTSILEEEPKDTSILNVLQHMWGYISDLSEIKKSRVHELSLHELLLEIQKCVISSSQKYLLHQIALSELGIWIKNS